jgi:hypothetical protein
VGVGKPLPELTSHTHTASSFNAVAFCLLSGLHEHDDMKPSRASSFATMRQVEVSQTQSRVFRGGGELGAVRQGLTLVHVGAQLEQLQDTFMS